MMQTFLFTGASGYIGSHSAFWFLRNREECKIIIYDNLSTGFVQNYEYLQSVFPNRVEFVKGDLSELEKLDSLFAKHNFSAVVHFAASLIVSESVSLPLVYYKNNTLNTTFLIDLCIKHGIQTFIFSSTAAVYGEPDSKLISESAPLAPINPYGASKMMSERVALDTHIANPSFNYAILRYFNVAGADNKSRVGEWHNPETHLIPNILKSTFSSLTGAKLLRC